MNAPYDGDRGRGAGGDRRDQYPPAPPGAQEPPQPGPYAPDPYLGDPYTGRLPADDGAAQQGGPHLPPPPPPAHPQQHGHQQQTWPPAPETGGPSYAYGDNDATQLIGADGFPDRTTTPPPPQRDAFAHLYRDQQQPYEPPQRQPGQQIPAPGQYPPPSAAEHTQPMVPAVEPPAAEPLVEPEPVPAAPAAKGGKAAGMLKSSALMAAGTMVSRLLGFAKQALIVAALGTQVLADTYTVANQLPAMVFFLTIGGGLNSVFIPQLVRSMKEDADGGEAYANRLLTLVGVILGGLTLLTVLGAEYLVPLMSNKFANEPAANSVTVTFVRYCMPTIFFMGVHVVMGQILNARGKFGAMMWTPALNNIVVIATFGLFLWVYGTADSSDLQPGTIPPEGIRLLGIGTLLGLVVQALAMIPYLRAAGFKIRPRFDWRGHGLGKAAKLAKWTMLFVLANQAGNLVVVQLATAAGTDARQGGTGITAYINAQLIWNMPQAILTVSIMAAMLPRLSRSAVDGDTSAVRDDISQGLRTSAVAIVPIAFSFLALGIPMCTLLFGSGGIEGARFFGYALMGFSLGLIPFSVQYVVLRAFYAYEDTRTPFYNTVIVAVVNASCSALSYFLLPSRWVVVGMGVSYGLAYAVGVGVAWRRLRNRLGGDLDGTRVVRTYTRLIGACIPATLIGGAIAYGIGQALGYGIAGSLAALIGGGVMLLAVFYIAAKRMRVEEVTAMVGMVRGRLGR